MGVHFSDICLVTIISFLHNALDELLLPDHEVVNLLCYERYTMMTSTNATMKRDGYPSLYP
jgi:hypothetical protein